MLPAIALQLVGLLAIGVAVVLLAGLLGLLGVGIGYVTLGVLLEAKSSDRKAEIHGDS